MRFTVFAFVLFFSIFANAADLQLSDKTIEGFEKNLGRELHSYEIKKLNEAAQQAEDVEQQLIDGYGQDGSTVFICTSVKAAIGGKLGFGVCFSNRGNFHTLGQYGAGIALGLAVDFGIMIHVGSSEEIYDEHSGLAGGFGRMSSGPFFGIVGASLNYAFNERKTSKMFFMNIQFGPMFDASVTAFQLSRPKN